MSDVNLEIQLGSTKHINSVNEDTYANFVLNNSKNELLEYNINSVLSVTDVFEQERQENEIYRIYGGLEYLSLFNGMRKSYSLLSNFFVSNNCPVPSFLEPECEYKTIYDDFNFYLVRPSENFQKLPGNSTSYLRYFEVIATPNEFNLFEAGYSKNIFDQQKYGFSFNNDFDISGVVDGLGMPITELYLYAQYQPKAVPHGVEKIMESRWTNAFNRLFVNFQPQSLNIGDLIYGDKIEYQESNYSQIKSSPLTYKITTPYLDVTFVMKSGPITEVKELRWEYNPLIPLRLRYFDNSLNKANINSTSYNQRNSIPEFATHLGNGNYVWRNILEQGIIDPITGDGVDYPFVNKKRYLFKNIILSIIPDLTHNNTNEVFDEIKFNNPTLLNKRVIDNINNIGSPC